MEKVLTKGLKGGRKLRKKIRYSAESKANSKEKKFVRFEQRRFGECERLRLCRKFFYTLHKESGRI